MQLYVLTPIPVPLKAASRLPVFEDNEYYEVTNGDISRPVLGELLNDHEALPSLARYFLPDASSTA